MLSIHTSAGALTSINVLNRTSHDLVIGQQRLATGYCINGAADNPAGLQIASRLNAQSRGMEVAGRNIADATSMLQTADSGLDEVGNMLLRMKDLATQAASDTNGASDRKAMQNEYDELGKELYNILENTRFNDEQLFGTNGDESKFSKAIDFQTGASANEKLNFDASALLTKLRDTLVKATEKFDSAKIGNTDSGEEISTKDRASTSIDTLTEALNSVGEMRASFGANLNRLTHIDNNLSNVRDKTDVARGRIMDTDYALESANNAKNMMRAQATMSMLQNDRQMQGMILNLLR
ncbi:flagellin [Pseudomonas plecoglossicida]|uniref:Flagellin n=1 Tax=Pseudomonas plecoglossicida TaxID=70775 RepID=A0AAD0R0B1_PSEDL|nr:flagellin [Pseudomonas plecoglossicida]AXM98885.1 Lateral flagellin [Pseudomonas plecoglossicida]EPB95254.1 flagellin domain-containing protein [Pseudomonas plecoglossicida NB2011]